MSFYQSGYYMSNWYSIVDQMFEFRPGFNSFVGENRSGKSTIGDSLTYSNYGNVNFNRGVDVSAYNKRTILSYTRGFQNIEKGKMLRPTGVVFTYLISEWTNPSSGECFSAGCIITTDVDDSIKSTWFIISKPLKTIKFTYNNEDGKKMHFSPDEFKRECEKDFPGCVRMFVTQKDAMNAIYYRLGITAINSEKHKILSSKISNALSFRPHKISKPADFICEHILLPEPITGMDIVNVCNTLDEMSIRLAELRREEKLLSGIVAAKNKFDEEKKKKIKNEIKKAIEEKYNIDTRKAEISEKFDMCVDELEKLSEKRDNLHSEQRRLVDEIKAIDSDDELALINKYKNDIKVFEEELNLCNRDIDRLISIDKVVKESCGVLGDSCEYINIAGAETTPERKRSFIDDIKTGIISACEKRVIKKHDIQLKANEISEKHRQICKDIETLTKKEFVIENLGAKTLKDEINTAARSVEITKEAKFICEFVKVVDEEWRDALEAVLGDRRYRIVADGPLYDIAKEVQGKLRIKDAAIINIDALNKVKTEICDNSIMNFIEVENATAKKYVEWCIGKLAAVENECVPDYSYAISKDLRYSGSMTLTYKCPVKNKLLGISSIEITLKEKKEERISVENELNSLRKEKTAIESEYEKLNENFKVLSGTYNLHAPSKAAKINADLKLLKKKEEEAIRVYRASGKDFSVYEKRDRNERRISDIYDLIGEIDRKSGSYEEKRNIYGRDMEKLEDTLATANELLNKRMLEHPVLYKEAEDEYAMNLAGKDRISREKTGVLDSLGIEKRIKMAEKQLEEACRVYAREFAKNDEVLSKKEDFEGYFERYADITSCDIEKAEAGIAEQTRSMNEMFRNQFVSQITQNITKAKKDASQINMLLEKLEFEKIYNLSIKERKDGSDYETILKFARLCKMEDMPLFSGITSFGTYTDEDKEVIDAFEEIVHKIAKEGNGSEYLDKLLDYRNYLDCDVLVIDRKTRSQDSFSKRAGYESGAGVQIPCTLITVLSVYKELERYPDAPKWLFMDEPLQSMTDETVNKTLDFFEKLGFQMFFATPDRNSPIVQRSNAVYNVVKDENDRMHVCMALRNGVKNGKEFNGIKRTA